jgi:putative tricarboxylic transport membrane protein
MGRWRQRSARKAQAAAQWTGEDGMLTKREMLKGSAAMIGLTVVAGQAGRAAAQEIANLQVFVPAAPGGGWDQTGRTMVDVLKAEKMIGGAQVTNVAGAGGTVALPQFINQWRGRTNAVMVSGLVMVGALIVNKSAAKLTQTVPLVRLTGEYVAVVVGANSPVKSMRELADMLRADAKKVSVAGGSAGSVDHILLGMIGKAVGARVQELNYVAYSGGGPANAAILGGHVTAGMSGVNEVAEHVKAGKMRLLAVSSPQRLAGLDAPTLRESGLDLELANWRGVFAPPGTSDEHRKALIAFFEKLTTTRTWKHEVEKRDWTSIPLSGDAFAKYVETESARIEVILKEIGLAS